MERQGFNGRVCFEVSGPNLREVIIRQGFIKAIPECVTFTGDAATLFENAIAITARTKNVRVLSGEDDPNIEATVTFFKFAHGNLDYRAVWDAFLDLPSIEINNEWMSAIIGDVLKAPVEVRPGSPSDEELEQTEEGRDFLAVESPT